MLNLIEPLALDFNFFMCSWKLSLFILFFWESLDFIKSAIGVSSNTLYWLKLIEKLIILFLVYMLNKNNKLRKVYYHVYNFKFIYQLHSQQVDASGHIFLWSLWLTFRPTSSVNYISIYLLFWQLLETIVTTFFVSS